MYVLGQDIDGDSSLATCNSLNAALERFYTGVNTYGRLMNQTCYCDDFNTWRPVCNRPNARFISNTVGFQAASLAEPHERFSALIGYYAQAAISHDIAYSEEAAETMEENVFSSCVAAAAGEGVAPCRARAAAVANDILQELKVLLAVSYPDTDTSGERLKQVQSTDYDFDYSGRVCNLSDPAHSSYNQCVSYAGAEPKRFRNGVSNQMDGSIHYGSDTHFRSLALRARSPAGVIQCELIVQNASTVGGAIEALLPTLSFLRHYHTTRNSSSLNDTDCLELNNESEFAPHDQLRVGGDVRANQNQGLLAIETLFVREHNYWCAELARMYPALSIEQRFQGVKEIVAAEQQRIAYYEYLPAVLGPAALPPYRGYDQSVSSQVSIWFDTVGFRFAHSQIPNSLPILQNGHTDYSCGPGRRLLKDSFHQPKLYEAEGANRIVQSLLVGHSEVVNPRFVSGLRDSLFAPTVNHDLLLLDVVRGRERGLCDYNKARATFDLPEIESFEAFAPDHQAVLRAAYNNDHTNIDPIIGGLAEPHTQAATVGPLFFRILVDQFSRTRTGDPKYYENTGVSNPNRFLIDYPAIRSLVDSFTVSKLIRRNSDIECLPDAAFYLPSFANPLKFADGSICSAIMQTASFLPGSVMCAAISPAASGAADDSRIVAVAVAVPIVVAFLLVILGIACFKYRACKLQKFLYREQKSDISLPTAPH